MNVLGMLQHSVSRLGGIITECQWPWLKNGLIRLACKHFSISLEDAIDDKPEDYPSFNAFFTRKLKPETRPIAQAPAIACPVDGCLTDVGIINAEQQFIAKNQAYSLDSLFGLHHDLAQAFQGGHYAIYYLSPQDYHHIHCPVDAELTHMLAIPGQLYSVKPCTNMPAIYTKNERVIALFNIKGGGSMAIIFIGAIMVGCTHTTWAGQVSPSPCKPAVDRHDYRAKQFTFKQGDPLGHFQFGSSVIALFSPNSINWSKTLKNNDKVLMGQAIGTMLTETT
jgi:phosphatidylserine decarboxylase